MLNIIYGRVRSGKTYTLTQRLIETLRSGDGDVILLVPEQYSFQSEKDILEKLGAELSGRVKTLSFTRLLDEVGISCGGLAGKRINNGIRTIMVGRALKTVADSLVIFAKQSKNTKFASNLASVIAEMKQSGISSEKLDEVSSAMADCRLKWKLHDIGIVMSAYDGLTAHLFIDPADDMNRLSRMLNGCRWFENKEIFIDCFSGFTGGEFAVLEQMIATAKNVTITLPCESATDEDEGAGLFSNVCLTANRLLNMAEKQGIEVAETEPNESRYDFSELKVLEKELFSSAFEENEEATDRINICCGDYPTDEATFVAKAIKKLVREEGYRFRDFAVVARNSETYAAAVKNAMSCFGVPCYIDKNASARDQAISVFALSAIDAASSFDTESIMRWLKTGLAGYSDYEVSLLENYTYSWNISGREWKEPWTKSPDGLTNRKSKDAASRLAVLEGMRSDIAGKLSRFGKAFSGSATLMAKAVYNLAVECKVAENLSEKYSEIYEYDKTAAQVIYQSYGVFMNVLSDISECYRDMEIDRDIFVSAFKSAVNEYEIGIIPMGLDEVPFGSADRAFAINPKVVFVMGMNQNVFPAAIGGEGLISLRDRKAMIDMDLPVSDRLFDSANNEKFLFYNAACRACEKVYFTYSRSSMGSEKLEISPYLLRIMGMFPNCKKYSAGVNEKVSVEDIESSASAKSALAQSFREDSALSASLKKYFAENGGETYSVFKSYLTDAFESKLSKDVAEKLYGKNVYLSATRIDKFFSCPFSYFCQYGIKAKKLEKSEMTALQRGSLAHYIFENILKEYGKELHKLSKGDIEKAIDKYAANYLHELEADEIVDYRWQVMVGQIKELCAVLCAEMGKQLADSDFTPVGFEVNLEEGGTIEPVELEIGDGGKVVLGGQVDRVDTWHKNGETYVCVVDYKTGKKEFHLSDLLWGLNMQMLLYLYSAVHGGKFEGAVPTGVLYIPSERQIEKNKPRTKAYSGILLNDNDVLSALDNSHSGRYIPISYNKGDVLSANAKKKIFTREEFDLLFKNAEEKLIEMGRELHNGRIAADPLDGAASNADACKYCDYRAVCLREKDKANRKVKSLGKEEIINVLEGEEDGR